MCAKRKRRNMGTDGKINWTIKSQRKSASVLSSGLRTHMLVEGRECGGGLRIL